MTSDVRDVGHVTVLERLCALLQSLLLVSRGGSRGGRGAFGVELEEKVVLVFLLFAAAMKKQALDCDVWLRLADTLGDVRFGAVCSMCDCNALITR